MMLDHLVHVAENYDVWAVVHAFIGTCEVLGLGLLGYLTARARRKNKEENGDVVAVGELMRCPTCGRHGRFRRPPENDDVVP